MKNLLFLLSFVIFGCNSPVPVTPISQNNTENLKPDFNFIATPAYDFAYPDSNFLYQQYIQLYLRPFENVSPDSPVILKFDSETFSYLFVKNDTLLPNDKIVLSFSDFTNYRLPVLYQTSFQGKQNLSFDCQINDVSHNYDVTFTNY